MLSKLIILSAGVTMIWKASPNTEIQSVVGLLIPVVNPYATMSTIVYALETYMLLDKYYTWILTLHCSTMKIQTDQQVQPEDLKGRASR